MDTSLEKVCKESGSFTQKLTPEWILKDVNEKLAWWRKREYCTHCYVGSVATQSSRKVRLERHIGCISGIFKFVL